MKNSISMLLQCCAPWLFATTLVCPCFGQDFFDDLNDDGEAPLEAVDGDGFDGQGDSSIDESAFDSVENGVEDGGIELGDERAFILSIREGNPSTPFELFRAIDQLIRVGRPDAAREYLTALQGAALSQVDLARLHQRFGTAALLRLSRTQELAPDGSELAGRILQAARQVNQDPQRLAKWVAALASESRNERGQAAQHLLRAGAYAVGPLVDGIATSNSSTQQQSGYEVLRALGEETVEPLIGQLANTNRAHRMVSLRALGSTGSRQVVPYLIGPSLAPRSDGAEAQAASDSVRRLTGSGIQSYDAQQALALAADEAYRGRIADTADENDRVVRWTWDAREKRVVRSELRTGAAASLAAARLYRELARMAPNQSDYGLRYLVSRLDLEQSVRGLELPPAQGRGSVTAQIQQLGSGVSNRVLQLALSDGHDAAAIAAVQIAAQPGMQSKIFYRSSRGRSALSQALTHSNRRVRFAAASAIAKHNYPVTFDGASRVADALGYFAASDGRPHVLIAHPRWVVGRKVAGHFSNRGYSANVVTTGRDLLQHARANPDLELIVLADILNPLTAWETIEELRANPITAQIPLALLAREDRMPRAERMSLAQGGIPILLESVDDLALTAAMPRLIRRLDRRQVGADERFEQSVTAVLLLDKWLAKSPQQPPRVDLRPHQASIIAALTAPETAAAAQRIVEQIGSTEAQLALIDLASFPVNPVDVRRSAAAAFEKSAAKFGLLLTREQISRQYDRYNASQDLDQDTQALRGKILDVIENPHAVEPAALLTPNAVHPSTVQPNAVQ